MNNLKMKWDETELRVNSAREHELHTCPGYYTILPGGRNLTKQAVFVLATACTNHTILNYISSMSCARFSV